MTSTSFASSCLDLAARAHPRPVDPTPAGIGNFARQTGISVSHAETLPAKYRVLRCPIPPVGNSAIPLASAGGLSDRCRAAGAVAQPAENKGLNPARAPV